MMKIKLAATAAVAILLVSLGGTVLAQIPTQGQAMKQPSEQIAQAPTTSESPTNNSSSTSSLSTEDKDFLSKSARDSLYEFTAAQLAVQKAQSPNVVRYGLRLMNDHAEYNRQLMQLARLKGVILPVELDSQKSDLEQLMQLEGSEFDRQYISESAQANSSDVRDLQKETAATQDSYVRGFVEQFLPVQEMHLQLSKALENGTSYSNYIKNNMNQ